VPSKLWSASFSRRDIHLQVSGGDFFVPGLLKEIRRYLTNAAYAL
jgi:hypothetical protein